jgi:hypothetical protein
VYWWIIGGIAALALLGLVIDRIALWAEAKGWIYWRRTQRRGTGSLGYLEPIFQPSITHVVEEETRQHTEAEQDQSGEDP